MKQDSIQQLLAKHQAGTLSDDELATLNKLTHKDEVFAAADRQASGIVRRRRLRISVFALMAVAVGGIGLILLQPTPEAPLVAQKNTEPVTETETIMVEEVAPQPEPADMTEPVSAVRHTRSTPKSQAPAHSAAAATPEPVVMCNNQAEADSVINDIWKFLTA